MSDAQKPLGMDPQEAELVEGPPPSEITPPSGSGLRQPRGLWVLFITEMWERFSYYGMRALLVLYLIASTSEELASGQPNENPGFGWTEESAAYLYAFYTWAVYLTPIAGGWLADKFLGTHRSMLVGGWIIAAGHITLAMTELFGISAGEAVTLQTSPGALITFILGLVLIIIGTGFFKPCVSVMVGQLYGQDDPRRDSGFTIFYMGINLGAFMSPLVAGYLGEKVGWHYGFGAAAVGMIAGIITYQFLRPKYLAGVGLSPKQIHEERERGGVVESKVADEELHRPLDFVDVQRIIVILILAFVGNIFFWAAFEQAGTSMNVFAKKDTDRTLFGLLEGGWTNTETGVTYSDSGEISDPASAIFQRHELGWLDPATGILYADDGATGLLDDPTGRIERRENSWFDLVTGTEFPDCGDDTEIPNADEQLLERVEGGWRDGDGERTFRDSGIITIRPDEDSPFERKGGGFPASFYQSVNALTIVICAPFFSLLWVWLAKRNANPSTPVKFCLGLWLLGLSFLAMVFGSMEAASGGKAGPHWLLITYVVYTWGELCLSPVGLSMVTKLAPAKLQSLMMGVWFFSFSLANLLGGVIAALSTRFKPKVAEFCVEIAPQIQIPGIEGLAGFYALLVALPIAAGFFILLISPLLKKMMHGVK
ncbi:MAG: peptide MFS transporter [Planctomycetota bacterium]